MTIQIAIQEIFTLIKCHTKDKSSERADGYIKLKLCRQTQSYFSVFHSNPVHFDNIFFFCKNIYLTLMINWDRIAMVEQYLDHRQVETMETFVVWDNIKKN